MHERIPLKRALLVIFLSVIAITGSATLGWFYYLHRIHVKQGDSAYNIEVIAATRRAAGKLESDYIAELLGLSKDKPVNLYTLSLKEAEAKLRKSPLIKKARVEKIKPKTLHIDYMPSHPGCVFGRLHKCCD